MTISVVRAEERYTSYITDEASLKAADHFTSPPITRCSTMLGLPTYEARDALLFKNFDDELDYL